MCVSVCLHSSMTSGSNVNNCYHRSIFFILHIILSGVQAAVAPFVINIDTCCFHLKIVRDLASVDLRTVHTAIDHYYYELNSEYSSNFCVIFRFSFIVSFRNSQRNAHAYTIHTNCAYMYYYNIF